MDHQAAIPPLARPDARHLEAAQGWLDLGNHLEANEELDRITPRLRVHPDVLALRWEIYLRGKQLEMCFEISRTLTRIAPGQVRSWVLHSNSLNLSGRTREALDLLAGKVGDFPAEWALFYNLACFSCHLGQTEDARGHLAKAIELGPKNVRLVALEDRDLEGVWRSG